MNRSASFCTDDGERGSCPLRAAANGATVTRPERRSRSRAPEASAVDPVLLSPSEKSSRCGRSSPRDEHEVAGRLQRVMEDAQSFFCRPALDR